MKLIQEIKQSLDLIGKDRLKEIEKVKNIYLHPEFMFIGDDELLTPTSKIKRFLAYEQFKEIFENLYDSE